MTAQPTDPPRNRGGRPRTVERRVPIGFPAGLLADIQQAADAAGTTFSAEVLTRCERAPILRASIEHLQDACSVEDTALIGMVEQIADLLHDEDTGESWDHLRIDAHGWRDDVPGLRLVKWLDGETDDVVTSEICPPPHLVRFARIIHHSGARLERLVAEGRIAGVWTGFDGVWMDSKAAQPR